MLSEVNIFLFDVQSSCESQNIIDNHENQMQPYLGELPQPPGDWHKLAHQVPHILGEASLRAVVALPDLTKDLVNGRVGGQSAVEDAELALETLRDVITTTARLDHGGQVLQREERGMDAM